MIIGHKAIDNDHRKLVRIINQFLITSKISKVVEGEIGGQYEAVLHATLKDLVLYGKQHFASEERIQRECMYDCYEMHAAEHRLLMAQLEEMVRSHFVTKTKKINHQSLDELDKFLKFWLVNHIMKFDTNLREWVCKEDTELETSVSTDP